MWLLSTLFPSDADVFGAASAAASSSADAEQEQSAALQHQHARAPAAQQKSAPIGPALELGTGFLLWLPWCAVHQIGGSKDET